MFLGSDFCNYFIHDRFDSCIHYIWRSPSNILSWGVKGTSGGPGQGGHLVGPWGSRGKSTGFRGQGGFLRVPGGQGGHQGALRGSWTMPRVGAIGSQGRHFGPGGPWGSRRTSWGSQKISNG